MEGRVGGGEQRRRGGVHVCTWWSAVIFRGTGTPKMLAFVPNISW